VDDGQRQGRDLRFRARGPWLAEAGAGLVALALAVAVVARVADTARSALLFSDGDSMLPVLVMRSIEVGQPQDWAMSSVLFLPELLVFGALWMLRLGGDGGTHVDATIVVNAVVNLVALYAVLRAAAGRRGRAVAPVAGALAAFVAFAVLAALDHTASRDSLELASLMTTATYYSATVIAVILTLGLLRRIADQPSRRAGPLVAVGLVAAVAVLSNPLFLLWATAPLAVLLIVVGMRRRERALLWATGVLAGGSVAGYLGRIPLAPFIANDGLGYIDVGRMGASAAYYGRLVVDLAGSPGGAASLAVTTLLFVTAVGGSIRLGSGSRAGARPGAFLVATAGWVLPLVVATAAIALGTNAARYLQPVVFAPVAALVVLPDVLRTSRPPAAVPRSGRPGERRGDRPWRIAVVVAGAAVVVASGVVGVPALAAATHRTDADLTCVTTWVDASGRTGGGQYWTVRLPKAHVADPRALVQVDDTLRPYDWLVNRDDAAVGSISFLVTDDQSPPFTLPAGVTRDQATLVSCGRYTIADFGDVRLPLGAPRS